MIDQIFCVYKIENFVNNKVYIGSTSNFKMRLRNHFSELRNNKHHSIHLQRSWNKYGKNAFKISIIEEIKFSTVHTDSEIKQILSYREQSYINMYDSCNDKFGYNIYPSAYSCLGVKRSEELKKHLSVTNKKIIQSAAWKNKLRNNIKIAQQVLRNTVRTKEWSEKIGNSHRNKPISQENRIKISDGSSNAINQLDLLGNIINTYKSVREASEINKYNKSSLSTSVTKRLKYKGYYWEYCEKDPTLRK